MKKDKPNILLITTDTLRCDALGCMGGFAHSPNIDALADKGVLFTQAHSPAPVCMPARCCIMSGMHASAHGCIENGIEPYENMPFFTETLKEEGYHTIMVGKTHFGTVSSSFDEVYDTKGEKNSQKDDAFSEMMSARGCDRNSAYLKPTTAKGHLDGCIVDKLIERIQAADKDKPFFAFCSLLSPHSPLDPPIEFKDLYKAEDIPPARYSEDEWRALPSLLRELCGIPRVLDEDDTEERRLTEAVGNTADMLSDKEIRGFKAVYYSLCAYCDYLVGRITEFLDASGLRENTLVIFTSDHGQQYYDHGFNDKHNYFDETMRVPFIMSMPGVLPQGETREFASLVDIAPTIAAAAGGKYRYGQGMDLYTPITKGQPSPRTAAAGEFYKSAALVTSEWKLIYYFENDEIFLYDRKNDSGENENLAAAEYSELAEGLLNKLLKWRGGILSGADIKKRSSSGGPVAARVSKNLNAAEANKNEKELMESLKR